MWSGPRKTRFYIDFYIGYDHEAFEYYKALGGSNFYDLVKLGYLFFILYMKTIEFVRL